jgi:predicted nucleic acid-binding protein
MKIPFGKKQNSPIKDINDAPFIALCLVIKADGIWSDDTHFQTQKQFTVFRTKNLALVFKKP